MKKTNLVALPYIYSFFFFSLFLFNLFWLHLLGILIFFSLFGLHNLPYAGGLFCFSHPLLVELSCFWDLFSTALATPQPLPVEWREMTGRADTRLADKAAAFSRGSRRGRSEVLKSSGHHLPAQSRGHHLPAQSPGHHDIDRPPESLLCRDRQRSTI